jgi:hypothetical protein
MRRWELRPVQLHARTEGSTSSPAYLDFSAVGLSLDFVGLAADRYQEFEAAMNIDWRFL